MELKNILSLCSIAAALTLAPATWAASDSTFSSDQKKQIETVVHDYLINNPQVLVEVSQQLQKQQEQEMKKVEDRAQQTIPKLAKELFNASSSPVAGNPNGNVTLVEFFDYQCPHCKTMKGVVDSLIAKDKNLRVVYKEFPIFGNSSVYASKAALAAAKQGKYAALYQALMDSSNPLTEDKVMAAAKKAGLDTKKLTADINSPEIQAELDSNLKLAQELGLLGTPAFVVGDTKNASSPDSTSFFVPGGFTQDTMVTLIKQVRDNKKS